ncbi:MAG: DUF5011 domain-containing protein, partial [Epsilonproteobacteria bacterium]|nr:DUF5011 domain-containing protein [Campylobacterota bacterium]
MGFTSCGTETSGTSEDQVALNKIIKYAESDGTESAPTLVDYSIAGIQGVTSENIEAVNAEIASLSEEEVNTAAKAQFFLYGTIERDITAPVISLNGISTLNVAQGVVYKDTGVTATDDYDGDLTSNIVTNGEVNTNVAGTYTLTYNVEDTAGNQAEEVQRTIVVIAPVSVVPTATPTA